MALQESFTRTTDGAKIVLRQSSEGVWSIKCLTPPKEGATQWELAWEYIGTSDPADPLNHIPLTEAKARQIYEGYMG